MTRGSTPRDLRERMERVAARSRPAAPKSSRRAMRAVPLESADGIDTPAPPLDSVAVPIRSEPSTRRGGAPPARAPRAAQSPARARRTRELPIPEPRTRFEALFAWGMWELTEVPARRWQWLKAVIRSGDSQQPRPTSRS